MKFYKFLAITFFTLGCATATTIIQSSHNPGGKYPAHWWAIHDSKTKPAWEILPNDCKPGEVILSKRNELGILSNFAPTPFTFHGKHYASLEGFWQMMKYPESKSDPRLKDPKIKWTLSRDQVSQLTAFEAHAAGSVAEENMKKLGITWITFKGKKIEPAGRGLATHTKLIEEATVAKVNQNPKVKEVLLSTGDLILKPDHHQGAEATKAWHYFDIYMKIRENFKRR